MTNAEKIVNGIINNENAGMVCRVALKDEAVAKLVCGSLEKYMYTEKMNAAKIAKSTDWLSKYLSFVSEKGDKPLSNPNPWAWYTVVCYASTFMSENEWQEMAYLGLPKLKLNSLPVMEDDAETEIEILKRCKEVCCKVVEQRKKGSVC